MLFHLFFYKNLKYDLVKQGIYNKPHLPSFQCIADSQTDTVQLINCHSKSLY